MNEPTCVIADTICRTVELGVTITGAAVDAEDRTHIFCEVLDPDRTELLTDKQKSRLFEAMTSRDEHVAVEVTHQIYLQIIAAYEHPKRREGKKLMWKALKRIQNGVPSGLAELAQLGRTLWTRRAEILAYFDVGVSNGPVEAINGRLEHLRGIAQGFRNLDHDILRSVLHSGQLANRINAL